MKLTLKARKRNTGITHEPFDRPITPKDVSLDSEGRVEIDVLLQRVALSGDYRGKIALSLSELHYLTGILEEKKLSLLMQKSDE